MKQKTNCLICGEEFEYYPSEKDGKYCSRDCYKKSRGILLSVKCEYCGKVFERKASAMKDHVFCSNECRAMKWNNKIKITCKVCGKEFYWRASRLKYYRTECCSLECRGVAKRDRVIRICKGCGKEFEIRKSHIVHSDGKQRSLYCSKECYTEFARGKNSHMYDQGQTFYPYCEKFDERLKERVRHFFGDVCLLCGATKEQNHNKRMDVHHVFIEKLACCESKIEEKDLVRSRLPKDISCFGQSEFSEGEILYIRMMVPLCQSCHVKVHHESNDMSFEQTNYRKKFSELIINNYNGKCSIEKKVRG
jgi:hypothetical protein